MPRKKGRKNKKTFFKIKERLVLIPPKKFFGRKLLGIFCLFLGSVVLVGSAVYFYLMPAITNSRVERIEVFKQVPFFPERLIIPAVGLDLAIVNNIIANEISASVKIKKNSEIIILGEKEYKCFLVTSVESRAGVVTDNFLLDKDGESLEISFKLKTKPPRLLIVGAELEKQE